jgi:hypothetical protein
MFHHLQLAVVDNLAERRRLAEVPVLECLHVFVELAIAAHGVRPVVFAGQHLSQLSLLDERMHAREEVRWVAVEVLQRFHHRTTRAARRAGLW